MRFTDTGGKKKTQKNPVRGKSQILGFEFHNSVLKPRQADGTVAEVTSYTEKCWIIFFSEDISKMKSKKGKFRDARNRKGTQN